jgi:AI-2 transport protein TqsA
MVAKGFVRPNGEKEGEARVESLSKPAGHAALSILAVLGVIAALYLLQSILIPVALAFLLACLLTPVTDALRRLLPVGPVGAAVVLFLLLIVLGLYLASLTAESLVQAANTLPMDLERLALRISDRLNDTIREQPYLAGVLPEPGTIDLLGDTNRRLLINSLSYRLADLTLWVAHGVIVLFLVLFLLAESEMLMPKLVRFFAPAPGDARSMERTLKYVTGRLRAYLVARTLLNIGLGAAVALSLWLMGINFAVPLGVFAGLTNYIPYIGNVAGGTLPVLVTLAQTESVGDALIVSAVFLAIVTVEGYVVMPYVMGRSLDLNGTTVLIACLFWGYLWGLMGLILAMPITVCMKLALQHVPSMRRWAELMSRETLGAPGEHTSQDGEPASEHPAKTKAKTKPGQEESTEMDFKKSEVMAVSQTLALEPSPKIKSKPKAKTKAKDNSASSTVREPSRSAPQPGST